MTEPSNLDEQPVPMATMPALLAEYADRLLLSTGLHADEAMLVASGQLEVPPDLDPIARALRAGWTTPDLA